MSSRTPDQPRRPAADVGPDVRPTGRTRPGSGPTPVAGPPRRTPASRPAEPARRRAPLAVAAGVAVGWAAIVSYLPVAVVLALAQFTGGAGSLVGALRAGLAGWLLGHGVPLNTPAGPLSLAPLALAALAAWRLARAGVHTSRAIGARRTGSPRQALVVAGAVGLGYGLLGVLAAWLTGPGTLKVAPVRAGLVLAVFGASAALVGALGTTGALAVLARRTPAVVRDALRGGAVAAALLLAAGAGAAGLAVATGGGEASDMIGAYRTGVAGQAGITLVSLAYAPNAAIWAAAYLLGPGFAVGTDTAVRTTEVSLGALPAVPLLAGLPSGPVGPFGAVLLAVPVLAGMAAGWLLARRLLRLAADERATVGWAHLLGAAGGTGPVAGVLLGAAAVFSGGALGDGRLAQIGPVAWQVAALAALVIGVGAMIGAAATRGLARSAEPPAGRIP
ncbi:cell division protein PerM, partial [Micromonospora echinofusca]